MELPVQVRQPALLPDRRTLASARKGPSTARRYGCTRAARIAPSPQGDPPLGCDRAADLGWDSSGLEPIVHVEEALLAALFLLRLVLPIRQRFLELVRRVDLFFVDVVECVLFRDLVCDKDEPADRT